jgi:hypothetical protein
MKSVHDLKEARDLRGLSKLLSHPVLATRVDVARALRDLGEYDLLAKALSNRDWKVAQAAAFALGETGDARFANLLSAALPHPDVNVTLAVLQGLALLRPAQAPAKMIELTGHANWLVRQTAIQTLAHFHDEGAFGAVVRALDDPHEHVRTNALRALGDMGDTRATVPLVSALQTATSPWERAAAHVSLGQLSGFRVTGDREYWLFTIADPARATVLQDAIGLLRPGDADRDLRIFGFLWARTDFVKYANQPLEGWQDKASFGSIGELAGVKGSWVLVVCTPALPALKAFPLWAQCRQVAHIADPTEGLRTILTFLQAKWSEQNPKAGGLSQ